MVLLSNRYRQGNLIYISQPLFRIYNEQDMQLHRNLFSNCLRLLEEKPIVRTELPSYGRVSAILLMHEMAVVEMGPA